MNYRKDVRYFRCSGLARAAHEIEIENVGGLIHEDTDAICNHVVFKNKSMPIPRLFLATDIKCFNRGSMRLV